MGLGDTVMVYEEGMPVQLFTIGVTVIVAVAGDDPLFVAVKAGTFPEPRAGRPMDVFVFVQVNVPPGGLFAKLVIATPPLLQMVIFAGTVTVGEGLTVMV